MPVDLVAPFVVAGIFELLAWWLRQTDAVTVDQAAALFERLVIIPMIATRTSSH